MHVTSARHGKYGLHLRVNGHRLTAGEKYTIIELGYAILLALDESSYDWLAKASETVPADKDGGRGPLRGSDGMAVTSDPVVVALSYTDWWARNSNDFRAGRSLRIPGREDAIGIVRSRRILNDFNIKYAGKLPSEWADVPSNGRAER
jgi:hypothetical protein